MFNQTIIFGDNLIFHVKKINKNSTQSSNLKNFLRVHELPDLLVVVAEYG